MKGHKGHHHRKADGGGVKEKKGVSAHEFTPGAPENKEAKDRKEVFKRGGEVHGKKGKERLDKRARGGRIMSGGGSVLSGAANISKAAKGSKGGNDAEDD